MSGTVSVAVLAPNRASGESQLRSNRFTPGDLRNYWTLFAMDHFLGHGPVDRLFKQLKALKRGSQSRFGLSMW